MYCITCIASLSTYINALPHVLHQETCIALLVLHHWYIYICTHTCIASLMLHQRGRHYCIISALLHQQRTALNQQHPTYMCVYKYICKDTCMCVDVYLHNVLQKSTTLHQNSNTFHEWALHSIKRTLQSMKRALQSMKRTLHCIRNWYRINQECPTLN